MCLLLRMNFSVTVSRIWKCDSQHLLPLLDHTRFMSSFRDSIANSLRCFPVIQWLPIHNIVPPILVSDSPDSHFPSPFPDSNITQIPRFFHVFSRHHSPDSCYPAPPILVHPPIIVAQIPRFLPSFLVTPFHVFPLPRFLFFRTKFPSLSDSPIASPDSWLSRFPEPCVPVF